MKTRHIFTVAMLVAASVVLSSCGLRKVVVVCPPASILGDAASYPAFRPGAEGDPAGEVFNAKLVGVTTDCDFDSRLQRTDSEAELLFRATRTPTGEAATYSVPYFVAVTYSGQILTKQVFNKEFSFRPGASSAEFSDNIASILNHVETGKLSYDYQIIVGMQLSDAQLNYNRLMERYTP